MIPSLLQIPSAVSDSKLHSVLPNNGKGDFQFERSTGATRINRDGLIEEVGYFSSELVQNGNFSELGSDVVIDGGFSNGLNSWVTEGVELAEGGVRIESDGSTGSFIKQAGILTLNKTYKLVFEVKGVQQTGSLRVGFASLGVANITDIGTYTIYFVANGSEFQFVRNSAINVIIDNVSVKQVDPNDRWTVTSADSNNFVEFTQGQARLKFLNTSPITQLAATAPYKGGKTYKLIVDVASVTSGSIKVDASGISELFNTAGVTTRIVSPTGNGNIHFYRASANVDITLNSVSLVEVQGDRPRLSYDITNGVVEDKPHLLLEPSSTNLVTFSEDLSQWSNLFYTIVTANSTTSPDGSVNADKLVAGTTNGLQLRVAPLSLTSGNTYTFSTFVKNYGGNYVILYMNDSTSQGIKVDLINETFTVMGASTNHFIKKFSNGWYQIGFTRTIDTNVSGLNAVPSLDGNNVSFLGDGVNGVYIWGTQAEQQSYATSYIPTAGTTITRAAETCNNSKPSVNSTEGVLYFEMAALSNDSTNRYITLTDGVNNRVNIFFDTKINL